VPCSGLCDWTEACRGQRRSGGPTARRVAASVPRPDRARKRAVSRFASAKLLNPIVRPLLEHGLWPRSHALLETTGRKSGLPRRVVVGNGLRGDTFWILTEHGHSAYYVKNMEADPRVRVKVGRRWRSGTAHVLEDDDVEARRKQLRRPVNDAFVRMAGSDLLTVRIDLDQS
jgi:deazaflavin-dependent oxidoreductase (nitroreductase family)